MHTKLPCRSVVAPHLSYWINDTPSGWYSLPVDIFLVRRRPSYPFFHLRCPISLMLPSRISSAAVSIPVVPHLCHCSRPPLSSPLIVSAISIIPHFHYASIVILPRLCCSPHCIIFHRSVYFSAVVSLTSLIGYFLALCRSVPHCLLRSDAHNLYHYHI